MFNVGRPILFIDEIHRFSKNQQDSLLGAVESGIVTLIGATTENPSFEVIRPLLSRAQVYTLKPLEEAELKQLLDQTLERDEILSKRDVRVENTTALFRYSGGDARKLLNILELIEQSTPHGEPMVIDDKIVTDRLQENPMAYDKEGEMHYDIISAFIKSIRGSDPDAAIYWLARMLNGGEDPLFIARRLIILASEDVGLADSRGLNLATSTYFACEKIGMPECAINLSHTTIFLALAAKSNSAYEAWNAAHTYVSSNKNWQKVPNALQQTPLHREDTYKYSHNYEANVSGQSYWNESQQFYFLKPVGAEKNMESLYLYRKQLKEKLNGKRNE